MESQTNLHVIDLISLNPNLKNELFVQNYELTGATKIDLEIDLKERMENKENLLDERLNIENEKPNDSNKE